MATASSSFTPQQFPKSAAGQPRYFTLQFQNISNAITTLVQTVAGKLPLGVYTVAGLPTGIAAGSLANVSDGAASLAWGATVTGGGTASYLVRYNGTDWTVVGK